LTFKAFFGLLDFVANEPEHFIVEDCNVPSRLG
jgi:hypothetical protein